MTNRGYPDGSLTEALAGWVFVLRDPVLTSGRTRDAAWLTFEGTDPAEAFGAAAAVGDFNGDGCEDVAVGAPGVDLNDHNPPGKVYVFHGPFEPGIVPASAAEVVLEGGADGDFFGLRLVPGDFDDDGVDDLAVAAPWDSTVSTEAGTVYVLAAP